MAKTNGYDTTKALGFVERIENVHKELDSARGRYMAECKKLREAISEIISESEGEGFDKKAIKGIVKERELLRKIEAIPDGFNLDTQNQFEALSASLGAFADTELGAAALNKIKEGRAASPAPAAGKPASGGGKGGKKGGKGKKGAEAAPDGEPEPGEGLGDTNPTHTQH